MFRSLLLLSTIISLSKALSDENVFFSWRYVNFTWPSPEAYTQALTDGDYIPKNVIIAGIKVWKDRVYLTLPRMKTGVPATLVSLPVRKVDDNVSPLLEPFPNWQMQKLDDCRAFQYVQSMEIDPNGRMWILENGRTQFLTDQVRYKCPARLVILDLENNGEILLDYKFSGTVVNMESVFLNDIVLDHEDGGWAYISDNDSKYPGIVVFSLRDKDSWKVSHKSMYVDKEAIELTIDGLMFNFSSPINGIALSSASVEVRTVYYCPLSSYHLYSISTWVLKNRITCIDDYVVYIGKKPSQSSGLVMSSSEIMFFAYLQFDSVVAWNTNKLPFDTNQKIIIEDHVRSQYPDTFAIDENKNLWYTSNRLPQLLSNTVDTNEIRMRLIVINIGAKSYQYYNDGKVPELPELYTIID